MRKQPVNKLRVNKLLSVAAATTAVAISVVAVPATAQAANKVPFGSMLDSTIQPSNSLPGLPCDSGSPGTTCSFVMNEAYGRPDGGELAPVSGTLKRVRVISGGAGSFQLQLVKAKQVAGVWQAKVKGVGPTINVAGQQQSNWDNDVYNVETFKVNMKIKRGWRLSMVSNSTSAVRCSSGGDNTLIFSPPLTPHSPFRPTTGDDGCWPLIEGIIKY